MVRIASGPPRPDKQTVDVVSAGGVILDPKGRVLILRRSDEGTWCFPKGHVEEGETAPVAAAREIREECGLECRIGRKVADSRYKYFWPEEDVNYAKRVVYFLAQPIGGEIRLEDRFDAWRWVTPERALRLLYHRNDKTVLRRALKAAALSGRT